jgi:ketosteroid isomerase-like protein
MSVDEKNIQIVKEMFSAYNRGDFKAVIDRLAEDGCDWRVPVTNKPRHTRTEVESFFREFTDIIDPIELKALRFTAQDDRVIVELNERGRIKANGMDYSLPVVMVCELKNGKVTLLHYYLDTAEIRRALETKVSKAA